MQGHGHGHGHDHEHGTEAESGNAARGKAGPEGAPDALLMRAAVEGRPEVLGAGGMLRLQRSLGNAGAAAALQRSSVHDVVGSGGGRALDPEVREDMEGRLGHDFGDVRVHTDGAAHDSAKSVNAHAYTVGSHIVFQRDAYDPGSHQGRTTLAHELTHVVQQRSGPVDGTETEGGIKVSDPGDRFEREAVATADRAMSAPAPVAPVQRAAGDGPGPEPAPELPGTGASVQRAEEAEEEEAPAE
ncbi:eCIS core domain-containing protein [Streptomyces sp. NPDC002073]